MLEKLDPRGCPYPWMEGVRATPRGKAMQLISKCVPGPLPVSIRRNCPPRVCASGALGPEKAPRGRSLRKTKTGEKNPPKKVQCFFGRQSMSSTAALRAGEDVTGGGEEGAEGTGRVRSGMTAKEWREERHVGRCGGKGDGASGSTTNVPDVIGRSCAVRRVSHSLWDGCTSPDVPGTFAGLLTKRRRRSKSASRL
eukprot:2358383-Pyramimonas_sp.AAC.2